MTNPNYLFNESKVAQIEANYYLPASTVYGTSLASIYAFIGQEDPWPITSGSEVPGQPQGTEQYRKQIFRNMIAMKNVSINNVSPVIQRIDWTANTVYSSYTDNAVIYGTNFYVRNKYDQVFKCPWNNNGSVST